MNETDAPRFHAPRAKCPRTCYFTTMKYSVAVRRTEEGYSISCPGLPGCWSQGATEEEALANVRDAIHDYLEVAKECGFPLPWPGF